MIRRDLLLLAAGLPFQVTEGEHLRMTGQALGWTILRDRAPRPDAPETGMVLIRVQRPVPPASRPGHLPLSSCHPVAGRDQPGGGAA